MTISSLDRPFHYAADTRYIEAATRVRETRAAYYAAVRTNPWDELTVRRTHEAYGDAVVRARVEEDRVLGPMAHSRRGVRS